MGRFNVMLLIFLLISVTLLSPSSASTIYDVLQSHGLPIGLLPKGVTNFTVDSSTGRFEVRLQSACSAQFESQVRYDFNVSGTIGYGRIGDLTGMLAQDLFLWLPVKEISVDDPDSGIIYFDVGFVRKQFPQSLFEIPRDCTAEGPNSPLGDPNSKNEVLPRPKEEADEEVVYRATS